MKIPLLYVPELDLLPDQKARKAIEHRCMGRLLQSLLGIFLAPLMLIVCVLLFIVSDPTPTFDTSVFVIFGLAFLAVPFGFLGAMKYRKFVRARIREFDIPICVHCGYQALTMETEICTECGKTVKLPR